MSYKWIVDSELRQVTQNSCDARALHCALEFENNKKPTTSWRFARVEYYVSNQLIHSSHVIHSMPEKKREKAALEFGWKPTERIANSSNNANAEHQDKFYGELRQ